MCTCERFAPEGDEKLGACRAPVSSSLSNASSEQPAMKSTGGRAGCRGMPSWSLSGRRSPLRTCNADLYPRPVIQTGRRPAWQSLRAMPGRAECPSQRPGADVSMLHFHLALGGPSTLRLATTTRCSRLACGPPGRTDPVRRLPKAPIGGAPPSGAIVAVMEWSVEVRYFANIGGVGDYTKTCWQGLSSSFEYHHAKSSLAQRR